MLAICPSALICILDIASHWHCSTPGPSSVEVRGCCHLSASYRRTGDRKDFIVAWGTHAVCEAVALEKAVQVGPTRCTSRKVALKL